MPKLITPSKSHEYVVGIDFGHAETSACVCKIEWGKNADEQKDEWEDYFTDYKNEITGINQQIEATDKEINSLVYKLYELTPEEIQTIENVE